MRIFLAGAFWTVFWTQVFPGQSLDGCFRNGFRGRRIVSLFWCKPKIAERSAQIIDNLVGREVESVLSPPKGGEGARLIEDRQ